MIDVNYDTRLQASINPVAQETMIARRGRTLINGSPLLRSHKAPPRAARSNIRKALANVISEIWPGCDDFGQLGPCIPQIWGQYWS